MRKGKEKNMRSLIEILVVFTLIYCFTKEDKFIEFEKKIKEKLLGRKK